MTVVFFGCLAGGIGHIDNEEAAGGSRRFIAGVALVQHSSWLSRQPVALIPPAHPTNRRGGGRLAAAHSAGAAARADAGEWHTIRLIRNAAKGLGRIGCWIVGRNVRSTTDGAPANVIAAELIALSVLAFGYSTVSTL